MKNGEKLTESEKKLVEITEKLEEKTQVTKQNLEKFENNLEIDVLDRFYVPAKLDEAPLTDIELAICSAIPTMTTEQLLTEFNISNKTLNALKRKPAFSKLLTELGNLRAEVVKQKMIFFVDKALDIQVEFINKLLDSDKESDRQLGIAYTFGRKSLLESTEIIAKAKGEVKDEKGDALKDFLSGLMVASNGNR